jgi:hypothetical protein
MTNPRISGRNKKRKDYKAMNLGSDSEVHSSDSDYEASKSKRQKSTKVPPRSQSSSSPISGDEDEDNNNTEVPAGEDSDPDDEPIEFQLIDVTPMTHKHASTKEKSLIWPHFTVKKLPNILGFQRKKKARLCY